MKPHLSWATDCHSGKGEENPFSVTLDLGTLCILDGRLKYWKVVQAFHRWIGGGMATISPLESPNHGILRYERGEQRAFSTKSQMFLVAQLVKNPSAMGET